MTARGGIGLLTVRLGTEVGLVAGAAWAASTRPWNVAVAAASGAAAALAVAAVWSLVVAPRSSRRLGDPWRLGVEAALFAVVAGGLAVVGHAPAAAALAVAGIGTAIAVRRVGPEHQPPATPTGELRRPRGRDRTRSAPVSASPSTGRHPRAEA